ncbi:MAG TPA: Gfo/Idh/MocA family oxidoreductase [Chloroflexota bacterium]|nr:Gfo/Idh/MocA family oxidoreductase [Chloroflexota bacterium]
MEPERASGVERALGWALIGCGGAGRSHARGAAETAGVTIRAFCDVRQEAAARLQSEFGGRATTDPRSVFDDAGVDVVSIATTHNTHTELALAAFEAGKHVFLEKPMAMSTAECLRIAAAQRAAGKQLMLNLSFRFSGALREVKRRIVRPKVSHAQCLMARADVTQWRWDPVAGGGPLWDVGVHTADLLCWLHDAPPVEVYATGGQVTHAGELRDSALVDTAAATLRFGDGSLATFLVSDAGFNAFASKWLFETYDGRQSAIVYDHGRTVSFGGSQDEAADTRSAEVETLSPPAVGRFPLLLEAIRRGGESYVPARVGILATLVVEQIIESIRSGRPQPVTLP